MKTSAIRSVLALAMTGAVAACGLLSDDEEPLSGERIQIRDQTGRSDVGYTGTAGPLPEPVVNQDWTQTNGRSSHASGHLAGPSAPILAWRANAGSGGGSGARITGAPIVTGGRASWAAPARRCRAIWPSCRSALERLSAFSSAPVGGCGARCWAAPGADSPARPSRT